MQTDVKDDVLDELFAAENARDWAAFEALLDPEVEWIDNGTIPSVRPDRRDVIPREKFPTLFANDHDDPSLGKITCGK